MPLQPVPAPVPTPRPHSRPHAHTPQGAKAKALTGAARVAAIHDMADDRAADPYALNKALRASLRADKRAAAAADAERRALGLHESVRLLPASEGDAIAAQVRLGAGSRQGWWGVRVQVCSAPQWWAAYDCSGCRSGWRPGATKTLPARVPCPPARDACRRRLRS